MKTNELKPILEHLIGAFALKPSEVTVSVDTEEPVMAVVKCHPEDYGRVLGTKAIILLSLRRVTEALIVRCGAHPANPALELASQPPRERVTWPPRQCSEDWTHDALEDLCVQTLCHCFEGKVQLEFDNETLPDYCKVRFIPEAIESHEDAGVLALSFETILNSVSAKQGGKKVRVIITAQEGAAA